MAEARSWLNHHLSYTGRLQLLMRISPRPCNHANDPLEVLIEPITRAREKKLKKALNGLLHNIWSKMDLEGLGTFLDFYCFLLFSFFLVS